MDWEVWWGWERGEGWYYKYLEIGYIDSDKAMNIVAFSGENLLRYGAGLFVVDDPYREHPINIISGPFETLKEARAAAEMLA